MDRLTDSNAHPLSDVEKIIWRLSEAAPLNVTMIARIRGPLTETALRRALDVLQSRHSLLQVRIEREDSQLVYRSDDVPAIPLRQTSAAPDSWTDLVESEINDPLSSFTGPLARCVHLQHPGNEHHLLLTFHHVVGDGMSGVYLIRDLLTVITYEQNSHVASHEPVQWPTAMDRRLPSHTRGWRGWKSGLAFQAVNTWADLRLGPPQRARLDISRPPDTRTIRIFAREFDEQVSERILQRSRQEGTTVHAALAAAMCLAVAEDIDSTAPVSIKFRTPVNVREQLVPPVGDDLGLFASMVFFRDRVAATEEFWQLARRIRKQIQGQVERGVPCMLARLMPVLYRLLRGDRLADEEFCRRWYQATPTTCGITNIGRLDIATEYGELQLESLHFAVALSALGDFSCTVSSLAGRLHCNFLCPEPVISRSHALELVDDIERRLIEAVD